MIDRKHFKTQANFDGFFLMHPMAQEIAAYMIQQALAYDVAIPTITETKTSGEVDKALGRVSRSHEDGRAWDFRTWNMDTWQREEIMKHTIDKYGHLGAFNSAGVRCLLVYHNSGHGDHIHCQLDGSFKV